MPEFEGLYGVGLWAIWNAFGIGGLKLLRVLCVGGPLLLVGLRFHREGVRWRGVALALLILVLVESRAWNLRPLYLSTMGLLLVSGWLHDHCIGRRPLPLWLPLLMLAWANLHPGVIMGQGLLVGAIAWEWLNQRLRLNAPLDRPALRRLTWIGGLGVAATFISPDPLGRLLYPFSPESHHPILQSIPEMRPLSAFLFEPPYTIVPCVHCGRFDAMDHISPISPIPALGNRSSGCVGLAGNVAHSAACWTGCPSC